MYKSLAGYYQVGKSIDFNFFLPLVTLWLGLTFFLPFFPPFDPNFDPPETTGKEYACALVLRARQHVLKLTSSLHTIVWNNRNCAKRQRQSRVLSEERTCWTWWSPRERTWKISESTLWKWCVLWPFDFLFFLIFLGVKMNFSHHSNTGTKLILVEPVPQRVSTLAGGHSQNSSEYL